MRRRFKARFLVFLLSLGMIFNAAFPLGVALEAYAAETNSVWTELADIDAAVAASTEGKSIAVTMTTSAGDTYALTSVTKNTGATAANNPAAKDAIINDAKGLIIEGTKDDYAWAVSKNESDSGSSYSFSNKDGNYLYLIDNNNGVKINSIESSASNASWIIDSTGYLNSIDPSGNLRYIGVYISSDGNTKDWRSYKITSNGAFPSNIKDETLQFWAYDRDEQAQALTVSDISAALEASSGKFMVKGVITCIDGKNLYLQDGTGAICISGASDVSGYSVGETVIATGTRGINSSMPQLGSATYEKVTDDAEKIDLVAASTTLGALTAADVCKYVTIEDLTVVSVSGTNVNVKDENNKDIQIYKAVLGTTTLRAGDVIKFTGAVGIYNSNLQLRNTNPEEIVITQAAPVGVVYSFGLASTISDGDEVIIYNPSAAIGLSNTVTNNGRMNSVQFTPQDGVIETDDTSVVWTVRDNSDGTFSFVQGDKTLGGVVSGTYNNLVVTGGDYSRFQLSGFDEADFNYFLKFAGWTGSKGQMYLEIYSGLFAAYGSNSPDKSAYGFTFYKKGADPETPAGDTPQEIGDLVTSLEELTDGQYVAIYSPSKKIVASTYDNGGWYIKGNPATITKEGKLDAFTSDSIWKVKINADGTYSFVSYDNEEDSLTVWPSGSYAELAINSTYDTKNSVNTWVLAPAAATENAFTIKSSTLTGGTNSNPAYVKGNTRNGADNFAGQFTTSISGADYALQFYKINPDDAVPPFDDGEWDGILTPGAQYAIYNNASQKALGLFKEANYALDPIPAELTDSNPVKIKAGNGAYAFTVASMGRYYTFMNNGKYLATNNKEEMLFLEPNADGTAPETAKWYLKKETGTSELAGGNVEGYVLYNKQANYNGSPVCIEYFASAFSGWTFNTKNDLGIYLFNFYPLTEDTKLHEDVVQDPTVIFDSKDSRCIEQDYPVTISLDDLCPVINNVQITFTSGSKNGAIDTENPEVCEISSDKKNYTFKIPADAIDSDEKPDSFTINVAVTNDYNIEYAGTKTVAILDEPFIEDVKPEPGSQTGDDKKPVISARVGNVGDNPQFKLSLNNNDVDGFEYKDGVLSYTPENDLADGRMSVALEVTRTDNVSAKKTWNFTVGDAQYQLYFGQLHSHTTYSDGSGTLDSALEYIESLPESANIQFVAFTDHSNYFDTSSAVNPEDALNDKSLMTEASRKLWEEYKTKAANFNENHTDIIALAGFEMTWSGGPGHINTFDSDGLVSRNNSDLNNKTNDAGMKLYYETLNKGNSINQFNHPGATFGTFADFSYWSKETDDRMFLVEVGNGEGQIGAGGYYPSFEEYTKALDKGWHLAPTNNQDNHKGRWGNANDARDVILTNDFSEQGLYDAIKALRVYSTEDKNLKVGYTVNGEPMGTIFEEAPDKLEIEVTTFDPDAEDSISKVEIIANSGKVVQTWDSAEDLAKGYFTVELKPTYSYYYVKVTQADKDKAVTAPVWTGKSSIMGIDDVVASSDPAIKDQEMTFTTKLSNANSEDVELKSLTFTTDGGSVIGTDTTKRTIPAEGTLDVEFKYTPTVAKRTTVTATAVITSGDNDYTFSKDVTFSVRENADPLEVVPISTVQAQTDAGYEYAIEGVVTSNASGYDKDTAFFDCIYVQDDTAGICCFPVSGEFKIGDKVRVEGYTEFYQGEMELQVTSIDIIGEGSVEPKVVSAAQINDKSVLGSLVTLKGTVESVTKENGLIQTIMVKDAAGVVARVFIDGYITTAEDVKNCEVGAKISATGLASYDDTFNAPTGPFPRIRIRDRKDVVCEGNNSGGNTPGGGTPPSGSTTPTVGSDHKQMGKDGTAFGKGASAAAVDKAITSLKSDSDPKGTVFGKLKLKSTKQTKNSVTVSWSKVKNAKKYVVYGNACGKKNKMKKLAVTTKANKKISKIGSKKLKKGKYYKFIVVALDKNNNVVSASKIIHVATTGGKVGNHKSVSAKKAVIKKAKSLKKGQTLKLNAKAVPKSKKLKVKKHSAVRYESSNTKIATVSKKGVVKAKAKGTCYVYAYAQNGVCKKIKIKVK